MQYPPTISGELPAEVRASVGDAEWILEMVDAQFGNCSGHTVSPMRGIWVLECGLMDVEGSAHRGVAATANDRSSPNPGQCALDGTPRALLCILTTPGTGYSPQPSKCARRRAVIKGVLRVLEPWVGFSRARPTACCRCAYGSADGIGSHRVSKIC